MVVVVAAASSSSSTSCTTGTTTTAPRRDELHVKPLQRLVVLEYLNQTIVQFLGSTHFFAVASRSLDDCWIVTFGQGDFFQGGRRPDKIGCHGMDKVGLEVESLDHKPLQGSGARQALHCCGSQHAEVKEPFGSHVDGSNGGNGRQSL